MSHAAAAAAVFLLPPTILRRYQKQHQMLQEIMRLFDSAKTAAEESAVQEQVLDIMQRMQV